MQVRFKHLVEDRDRHGNIRLYVRLPGRKKVRVRAPFGTDEFTAAYNAAVSDHVTAPAQARETKAGSFRHLCVLLRRPDSAIGFVINATRQIYITVRHMGCAKLRPRPWRRLGRQRMRSPL
jgi:hypothetical protein